MGGVSRTYNLGYDNASRRSSLQIPLANGTDYVASTYGYDNANNLTNLLLQGASAIIDSLTYTYDPNGDRTAFSRIATPVLSPAISGTNYDAANEMLAYNSKNVTYDANGNLQTKTDSCGSTTYAWDARNRLTGMNGYKSDCTAQAASFSYDSLNRRISKTINSTTTQYVYDKLDIIQEITGGVTTNYVRTLYIDEPLTRTNSTVTRHYVWDALGSIMTLADDMGATKTTYIYDTFGNVIASGETSDNPFQYTARENDGTGLYYYRARYYSPEMQRFISEDPIRLAGGDINFFAYVQNSPLTFIDPLGLIPKPRGWLLGGGPGGPCKVFWHVAGATIVGVPGRAIGISIGMEIGFYAGAALGLGGGPLGSLGGAIVGGAIGGVVGGFSFGLAGGGLGGMIGDIVCGPPPSPCGGTSK